MEKLFTYGLAMVVGLGTTALLATSGRTVLRVQTTDAQMSVDGAFRDGLYVGRLASEEGRALRPPVGRWSNERDRASFVAGYRRGYGN